MHQLKLPRGCLFGGDGGDFVPRHFSLGVGEEVSFFTASCIGRERRPLGRCLLAHERHVMRLGYGKRQASTGDSLAVRRGVPERKRARQTIWKDAPGS